MLYAKFIRKFKIDTFLKFLDWTILDVNYPLCYIQEFMKYLCRHYKEPSETGSKYFLYNTMAVYRSAGTLSINLVQMLLESCHIF